VRPRESARPVFGLKRLAFIADSEIRGVAEVTAALRSACFQELWRVRRSEAGIDYRKSQGHTQFSCDLITSSGRM